MVYIVINSILGGKVPDYKTHHAVTCYHITSDEKVPPLRQNV